MFRFLVFSLFLLANPGFSENVNQDVVHWRNGKIAETFKLSQFLKLAPAKEVRVLEPHENQRLTYKALSVEQVLDKVDKKWRQYEDVQFICADNYKPTFPVSRLLKEKAYFAYEIVGRDGFYVHDRFKRNKKTPLGPVYLIWDSKNPEVSATGWAYQIIGVEFISFRKKFASIIPKKTSSIKTQKGYQAFRTKCLSCHSLKGLGGKVGPELHSPVSVTEYIKLDYLKKWILDPSSMRLNTDMPKLFNGTKKDIEVVNQIIHYLQSLNGKSKTF